MFSHFKMELLYGRYNPYFYIVRSFRGYDGSFDSVPPLAITSLGIIQCLSQASDAAFA